MIGDIYRIIQGRLLGKPENFSWLIKGRVAGCGCPMSKRELEWIKSQKVEAILSLTEKDIPDKWIKALGLDHLHLSIANHNSASIEVIDEAVHYIHDEVAKGLPVAVHCSAGQGRTGMILAAYLIFEHLLQPEEAIATIRRMRPGSIEKGQEDAVQKYYIWLHKSGS